jgi:hypothetical protein
MDECAINVEFGRRGARLGEPMTLGVPLPRGVVRGAESLTLHEPGGGRVALQARALDRWSDGSVRWALLDWQASGEGRTRYSLRLDAGDGRAAPPAAESVRAWESGDRVEAASGPLHVVWRKGGFFPFDEAACAGEVALDPARSGLSVEDADGTILRPDVVDVAVEERGPVRACVRVGGTLGAYAARVRMEFTARFHLFARSRAVRMELTLRNPRRALHPGGFWELGDPGSHLLRDASLVLAPPAGEGDASILCSPEERCAFEPVDAPVEIYQDSSGGRNWASSNHVNREGRVPHSFRGYRLFAGGVCKAEGERASPVVVLSRGRSRVAVSPRQFWQNFPKALEATRDAVILRLFPRQFSDLHELQGGEQKTHGLTLLVGEDAITPDAPLAWTRDPSFAATSPEWNCSSGALPGLSPRAAHDDAEYLRLVESAIDGDDSFDRKREVVDEYGWRHFGDIYGDHEAVFHQGRAPLVSHYNNQYDALLGFGLHLLRSGDRRWWPHMDELARHVIDIDIYHTTEDRPLYNGGLFWHTVHYVDAGRANHRSYPRAPGVPGGGPYSEQNYTSGLMLHYFLTGSESSREACTGLARWVLDLDEGTKTPFRWLDRGPTGFASASGSFSYHGPGRAGANSLNALVDGHRLTSERRFLEKAEELIRRCVHPEDDVAALTLLDAERRWYYTMFLQSMGKYLEWKIDRDELDEMYAYGRASLRRYALWMAASEYPYLEKPEILEYPTETWAAQDMRKCEVFLWAARHAEADERSRFLERAEHFFLYSKRTLSTMPTRSLCRPVVLLLTNGLQRLAFRDGGPPHAPPARVVPATWPRKARFEPQRARAIRRAKWVIAFCAAAALAAGALLGVALLR